MQLLANWYTFKLLYTDMHTHVYYRDFSSCDLYGHVRKSDGSYTDCLRVYGSIRKILAYKRIGSYIVKSAIPAAEVRVR